MFAQRLRAQHILLATQATNFVAHRFQPLGHMPHQLAKARSVGLYPLRQELPIGQHVTGEVTKQLFLRAGIAAQIDFSLCRAQDFFRAPDGGSWL